MALLIVPDTHPTPEAALAAMGPADELQLTGGEYTPPAVGYFAGSGALIRPKPGTGAVLIHGVATADTWRIHAAGIELRDLTSEAIGAGNDCYALNADGIICTRTKAQNYDSRGFYSASNDGHHLNECEAHAPVGGATAGIHLGGAGSTVTNPLVTGPNVRGIRPDTNGNVFHSTVLGATLRGIACEVPCTVRDAIVDTNPGVGLYLSDAGADADYVWGHGNGTFTQVIAGVLGAHVYPVDPLFVDAGAGNYRLQGTSPCIDGGLDVGLITDLDGNPRPVGGGPDGGCYEFQGTPPYVVGAVADGLERVRVTFDQDVLHAADDPAAWAIAALSGGGAVSVAAVSYDSGTFTAELQTTLHTPDQVYRVTAPAAVTSLAGMAMDPARDTADYLTQRPSGREAANPWAATGDGQAVDLGAGPYELVPWSAAAPLSSLEEAVWISLFTDRRAADDDPLPDPSGDLPYRGGWWADALAGDEGPIGSRLWLLARETIGAETVARAQEYASEALDWLVSGGYVAAVEAVVERAAMDLVTLVVTLHENDGSTRVLRCPDLWAALAAGE